MQLHVRDPSLRVHWIAIAVASRAGNEQGLEGLDGPICSKHKARHLYLPASSPWVLLRKRKRSPIQVFDPAIPKLGVVGHMRCVRLIAESLGGMELTPRFK